MIPQNRKNQRGLVALMSVIIISAVLLVLMVSAASITFRGRFNALDYENKKIGVSLAESCVQAAMLELAKNASSTVPLGETRVDIGSGPFEYCKLCKAEVVSCPASHSAYFRCWDIYARSKYERGQSGAFAYTNIRSTVGIATLSAPDLTVISWTEEDSGIVYGCVP